MSVYLSIYLSIHLSIYIYIYIIYIWLVYKYINIATFCSYFNESFSGEYHMYQLIPLHSCNYLEKFSIKINVAIEIGVVVQSWL